jgi:hypothetical protein
MANAHGGRCVGVMAPLQAASESRNRATQKPDFNKKL